jgi:hypothetical protein
MSTAREAENARKTSPDTNPHHLKITMTREEEGAEAMTEEEDRHQTDVHRAREMTLTIRAPSISPNFPAIPESLT